MARITVEDCLVRENNRFALVQLAAKRAKQLLNGSRVLIGDQRGNKAVVTSLREIAAGLVRFMTEEERLARDEARKKAAEEARSAREAQAQALAAAQAVGLGALGTAPVPGSVGGNNSDDEEGEPTSSGAAH